MIVPNIFRPRHPIDFVLILTFLIPQAIKEHIYGFGMLLNHASIYNSVCSLNISFQSIFWLKVVQFLESISDNDAYLCIIE